VAKFFFSLPFGACVMYGIAYTGCVPIEPKLAESAEAGRNFIQAFSHSGK
jgi:hypothetical protein